MKSVLIILSIALSLVTSALAETNNCNAVVICQAYCAHGSLMGSMIHDLVVSSGSNAAEAFEVLQKKCDKMNEGIIPFLVTVNDQGRVGGSPATLSSCK